MKFTSEQIAELPTLEDVILNFADLTDDFEDNGGWLPMAFFPPNVCWHLPMVDFFNLADNDRFIVTQTDSKRHTLKPNLRNRPFLYRGQRKDFGGIISGFTRDALSDNGLLSRKEAREYHLINNLKAEEFIALLKTHPLFMMLDRGIVLDPERKPIFINMNYYGLAQHYGFHTGLIDFTTDIDAAAFFACTRYLGDDKYEPVTDIEKDPYGVIYVHKIRPEATFKFLGFSTIGLQLYPRSGAQKGVCYNEGISQLNVNELVRPVYFRHDPEVSKRVYDIQKGGKLLFPKDSISKYAQEILSGSEISGETFAQNLYSNQDDFQENLSVLAKHNINVNWHKRMHFTDEMLQDVQNDLKDNLWEKFCEQIYFADGKKGKQMHDSLLNLPHNPAYKHFFDMDEYERITAYDAYLHRRARSNSGKKN